MYFTYKVITKLYKSLKRITWSFRVRTKWVGFCEWGEGSRISIVYSTDVGVWIYVENLQRNLYMGPRDYIYKVSKHSYT